MFDDRNYISILPLNTSELIFGHLYAEIYIETVVNVQNYIGVAYQSSMPQDMLLLAGGYIPGTESSF
jgi:hypothetical protein